MTTRNMAPDEARSALRPEQGTDRLLPAPGAGGGVAGG